MASGLAESHATSGSLRVLYASDWFGSGEIYAADPSGRATDCAADVRASADMCRGGVWLGG
jgi:hypothetical protein